MAKNNFYRHLAFVPVLCLILQLTACDANTEEETDPTGATPSTSVGKAVGAVNQLIAQDTLAVANEVSDNTTIALQAVFNFEDPDRTDFEDFDVETGFQASVNPGSVNDIYNFESLAGTLAIEDLARELTADGASASNWPGENCATAGVCDCSNGGTRTYTGTFDIAVASDSPSGSISGDYSITYNDCVELLQLNVDDDPCTMVVELNGTIEQSLAVEFSDFQERDTTGDFTTFADRSITQTSNTRAPITFANAPAPTFTTFTADDTVEFNFNYDFADGTAVVEPKDPSALTYDGVEYNMVVMQDFIESSTNAEVCP